MLEPFTNPVCGHTYELNAHNLTVHVFADVTEASYFWTICPKGSCMTECDGWCGSSLGELIALRGPVVVAASPDEKTIQEFIEILGRRPFSNAELQLMEFWHVLLEDHCPDFETWEHECPVVIDLRQVS